MNNLKDVWHKLKKFIKGFFKVNYEVELLDKPKELDYGIIWQMKDTIADITHKLGYYPIRNIRFGLKDYTIEKVDNDNLIPTLQLHNCKVFSKVSSIYYETSHIRETNIKHQAFCLCIDNKVWKFEFNMFFIYDCWNSEYNCNIAALSVPYINKFIDIMGFNSMLYRGKIHLDSMYKVDSISLRKFSGIVQTFGDLSRYNLFSLATTLPEEREGVVSNIIDEIGSDKELDEFIRDTSMIVDVIRKKHLKISLRGE